jgi:general secretion pathway protein J
MTRRTNAGFTLVELLVVMTLLSLIVLALSSALQSMAQTQERLDARLTRTDDLRVTSSFLQGILGRVVQHRKPGVLQAGENPFLFSGQAHEIAWIGVMPARYGAGGRYFLRLALEGEAGHSALVLRYAPWADDGTVPDWSSADRHVLATSVDTLDFAYEDAAPEPPAWAPVWASTDALPARVRISLSGGGRPWPTMVVPLRVLPGSSGASAGGAVFGGSR